MVKVLKKTLSLGLLCVSFQALPYGEDLTFDKLKDSCINFSKYGYQRPPANIIVNCSNAEYDWEQVADGTSSVPTERFLSAGLISDKNKVSVKEYQVATNPYDFNCPNFKEVLKTLKLELKSSCTELVSFTGDLKDFCFKAIEDAIKSNPDIVSTVDTGKTLSSCNNKASPRRDVTHQKAN